MTKGTFKVNWYTSIGCDTTIEFHFASHLDWVRLLKERICICRRPILSLALKVPITNSQLQQTTFINIFHCFSEKIRLDVSSESSARQRIHMKNQAIFSVIKVKP